MSMTENDQRAEYIAGLRALADVLERDPKLPLPTGRTATWAVDVIANKQEEHRAIMANIARRIPGRLVKNDPSDGEYDTKYMVLTGNLGGLAVEVWAARPTVCRRVVTGTREVTKTVPAPDAPTVEVTETVEDVEWVCEPLLAEATR